jgi:hypothetical protein
MAIRLVDLALLTPAGHQGAKLALNTLEADFDRMASPCAGLTALPSPAKEARPPERGRRAPEGRVKLRQLLTKARGQSWCGRHAV